MDELKWFWEAWELGEEYVERKRSVDESSTGHFHNEVDSLMFKKPTCSYAILIIHPTI